jgi:Tol biopolymer transport system component
VLAEVSQATALNDPNQNPISLQSFAPDGSNTQTLATGVPNSFPYPDPAFQEAGNTVMYATATCQGAAAFVTSLDGSPPVNVTSPTVYALSPHLSPDGLTVAFSGVGSKGAYLALAQTDRSATVTPVTGAPGTHSLDFSPDGTRLAFAITSQTFDLCGMP